MKKSSEKEEEEELKTLELFRLSFKLLELRTKLHRLLRDGLELVVASSIHVEVVLKRRGDRWPGEEEEEEEQREEEEGEQVEEEGEGEQEEDEEEGEQEEDEGEQEDEGEGGEREGSGVLPHDASTETFCGTL